MGEEDGNLECHISGLCNCKAGITFTEIGDTKEDQNRHGLEGLKS